jgi:WD40 repeat protein
MPEGLAMVTDALQSSTKTAQLDAEHPWPGLPAYEEASYEFFHGRKAEAAELLRLIRLNSLTVLYGKSGLGKSSLLQAGLFPLLRSHRDPAYLPVYCRLDFSAEAVHGPLDQVAHRLAEEMDRVGAEGPARESGEGLWEYLHRSELEIWSHDNFLLTPLLVLDQFEELFSHAGGNAERIGRVFDDMAALIENRIPAELAGEGGTERRSRLDLLSQPYHVVLSFREDYLPDVKTWEKKVPSLLRNNYLRLEPLTRRRAIEAIELAGAAVLEEGVAPAIVDFVGKLDASVAVTENDRAVIEPALLSLFCRQLNLRRGDKRIDEALIAESGEDILDHFYRQTLDAEDVKGLPDVGRFIQDYLVQGDRFRGLFPKDEALKAQLLSMRQLDALTARHRLLRVVEYAGTFRIELIHDCLVPVVCRARDERKSREMHTELVRKAREAEARAREKQKYILWLTASLVLMGGLLGFALWEWDQAMTAEERATAHIAIGASYLARREKKDPDVSALMALQGLSLARRLEDRDLVISAENQLRRRLSFRLLRSFRHPDDVNAVAFSADGRRVVSASGSRLHIWSLETGKDEATATPLKLPGKITKIAFAADGTLVAGDDQGDLRLWNLQTGEEKTLPNLKNDKRGISGLAAGPGSLLASATARGGNIFLWDIASGEKVGTPFGQGGERKRWFYDLSFTRDGSRLAAADVRSGRTTVWDIGTPGFAEAPTALFILKNWKHELNPAENPNGMLVNSVAFSWDGRLLATGNRDDTASLWDGTTGEHRVSLTGHSAPVRKVSFNSDASRLATASEDGTAVVWDTVTGKPLLSLVGHKHEVLDLDFSPDGSRLATAGGRDRTARVWNAEANGGGVYAAAFSLDNKSLATAGSDGIIRVWDVESRELVARLIGHRGLVHRVVFSPDGEHLASASDDKTARIWNWRRKQEVAPSPLQYPDQDRGYDKLYDIAYSPDGKWLATAGANFNAVVWEAATGQPKFAGRHEGMVWAVAFSPDGKYLASAGHDGVMKLWEVPSGTLAACAKGPKEEKNKPYGLRWLLDVNFSPDGNRLVMATGKGEVYLVDRWRGQVGETGSGTERAGADEPCRGGVLLEARRLDLRDVGITTAKFTPDGKGLITTGSRYQVTIQDAGTGEERNRVGVHLKGRVNDVALSPDGFWIATASTDGSFSVSPLETEDLWRAVCDRLSRKRLDAGECREYLGRDQCPPPVCDGVPP